MFGRMQMPGSLDGMGQPGMAGPPMMQHPMMMPPRDFTMRGNLPSFGALSGGMGGMPPADQASVAQMFPQFMAQQQGPQYGRNAPSWQNNWAMEPSGQGAPLPEGIPPFTPVSEWTPPPVPGVPNPAAPGVPSAPGAASGNDPFYNPYYDPFGGQATA